MNAGNRADATKNPFTQPTINPTKHPSKAAVPELNPARTINADTTDESAITDPIDRSIPPPTTTNVIPIAPNTTTTD